MDKGIDDVFIVKTDATISNPLQPRLKASILVLKAEMTKSYNRSKPIQANAKSIQNIVSLLHNSEKI